MLVSNGTKSVGTKRQRWGVRGINAIEMGEVLGSGTFGVVFRAIDNGTPVALKKVKMERQTEGFPITSIREMRILKILNHENIVKLHDVIIYTKATDGDHDNRGICDGDVFIVFEYVEFDLYGILKSPSAKLTKQHIKSYMHQLLNGMFYMHTQAVLHRDIKSANILLTRDNVIKIADCGLARLFHKDNQRMSREVCTLWYRSPELLMGIKSYGPEIDIWSVGVLFGELIQRQPILTGDTVARQLQLVQELCGTPIGDLAKKYETMIDWAKYQFTTVYPSRIRRRFEGFEPLGVALLEKLLDMDPASRISAAKALDDEYFFKEVVDGVLITLELPAPQALPRFENVEYSREGDAKEEAKRREEEVKKAAELLRQRLEQEKEDKAKAAIASKKVNRKPLTSVYKVLGPDDEPEVCVEIPQGGVSPIDLP